MTKITIKRASGNIEEMELKNYFVNYGIDETESEILAEYCERSGNTKERALAFAEEILAEYEAKND